MDTQDLQKQIKDLSNRIDFLERISIQLDIDPTTQVYLQQAVSAFITSTLALAPTQTYSTSAPSLTAPTGSLWMEDTGVLATNKIHVYSGSAWIRMK